MSENQGLLEVIDINLIAAGSERECYSHPTDPGLCLKIPKKSETGRNCPQCRVDLYTAKRLTVRNVPMTHAAHCSGWVETSKGPALVMERIRDDDGSTSQTLRQALEHNDLSWEKIRSMLEELRSWAMKHAVVISELNVNNLMLRKGAKGDHLVVIDGLGGRKPDMVFYLRLHIPWMARHKTAKRWAREYGKVKRASLEIIANRNLDGSSNQPGSHGQ